ncbi:unnamed protein product [Strongylus vulgaris]|uniref:N-acetyltransferase domain-containing protein n=1 Tax=Strongylus vulgaris TaxID=40348 RepID=A0A3P7HXD2_STRVU|nr:unnamed protein product [Strongylus vulgaris]
MRLSDVKRQIFLGFKLNYSSKILVLCLLDFYVHFALQRKGHGKAIIDYMLHNEHAEPYQLALDNPSVTLLGFLSQRYGLTKPVWQNTNFVVFEELFKTVNTNGGALRKGGVDLRLLDELEAERRKRAGWNMPSVDMHQRINAILVRKYERLVEETLLFDLGFTLTISYLYGHAMNAAVEADQSPEGALANRAHQAKERKAHHLSSQPLW